MQWSPLTEEKQKNQLAQAEFRFIKTIIVLSAEAITGSLSPLHQRCTGAKDGKLQGTFVCFYHSHSKQTNAMECFD
jgi:hypothetical protein